MAPRFFLQTQYKFFFLITVCSEDYKIAAHKLLTIFLRKYLTMKAGGIYES
jgi:hypothetical protein